MPSAAALGPLPGARLRNRVPYAVRTHKCRAHIWAQSPTLETTLFCANQTDLFAYRFSDFGSIAPPREGLAWKACAGTRPNENTLILLAPAARRKGHRGGLLHRRTWLVEMASGFGYLTGGGGKRLKCRKKRPGLTFPPKYLVPTAAPPDTYSPFLLYPDACFPQPAPPPPTPRSHEQASTDARDAEGSAAPAARPWFPYPEESSPALSPLAFPAWHRSKTVIPSEINPTPRAALWASAIPRIWLAPATTATNRCCCPAPRPPPPRGAPSASSPAHPKSPARASPNGFRCGSRTSPNSDSATGGNRSKLRRGLIAPARPYPGPDSIPPATCADS